VPAATGPRPEAPAGMVATACADTVSRGRSRGQTGAEDGWRARLGCRRIVLDARRRFDAVYPAVAMPSPARPLSGLGRQDLDEGRGIRQPVGVVIAAFFGKELHAAAVVLPELDDVSRIVIKRHDGAWHGSSDAGSGEGVTPQENRRRRPIV